MSNTSIQCIESQPGRNPRHSPPGFFYKIIFFSEVTKTEFTIIVIVFFTEHVIQTSKGQEGCFDGARNGSAKIVGSQGALLMHYGKVEAGLHYVHTFW